MKKLVSIIILVCMLSALVLTGCGSAQTPAADSQPADAAAPAETEAAAAETPKEPVTLKVGLLGKSVKPVGVLVADAMGYFDEEGVKVEFEKVSSMNDAYMAVSTGDLDVYLFSSTAAATFISQGTTTLRVFGGTAAEGSEIIAAKGTPHITGVDDLLGKTIACQMPETGQMVLKNYLLEQGYTIGAPGEGADVTFVYVNDGEFVQVAARVHGSTGSEWYEADQALQRAFRTAMVPSQKIISGCFYMKNSGVVYMKDELILPEATVRGEAWYQEALRPPQHRNSGRV